MQIKMTINYLLVMLTYVDWQSGKKKQLFPTQMTSDLKTVT